MKGQKRKTEKKKVQRKDRKRKNKRKAERTKKRKSESSIRTRSELLDKMFTLKIYLCSLTRNDGTEYSVLQLNFQD